MPAARKPVIAHGEPSESSPVVFSAAMSSPNVRQMGARWVDTGDACDAGLWIASAWGWIHAISPLRAAFIPKSKSVCWRNMQVTPAAFHVKMGEAIIPSAQHGALPPARSVSIRGSHSIAHTDDACWLVVERDDQKIVVLKISDAAGCYLCPEPVGISFGAEWRAVAHVGSGGSDSSSSAASSVSSEDASAAAAHPVLDLPSAEGDCAVVVYTRPISDGVMPPPPVGGTAAPHEEPSQATTFPLPHPNRQFGVSILAAGYEVFEDFDGVVRRNRCCVADIMERYHLGRVVQVSRVPAAANPGSLKRALASIRSTAGEATPRDVSLARAVLSQLAGNSAGVDVPDWAMQ
uniref:Uncharacterized protein n=1 Tax=Neobodo designis TaxID=312471 RepID=A0A7S1QDQ1_NEODS